MKTGIELIAEDRRKTIAKGISVEHDVEMNANKQLVEAICLLVADGNHDAQDNALYEKLRIEGIPSGWEKRESGKEDWEALCKKSYKDRLIAAGQMIAAEIDRISYKG